MDDRTTAETLLHLTRSDISHREITTINFGALIELLMKAGVFSEREWQAAVRRHRALVDQHSAEMRERARREL